MTATEIDDQDAKAGEVVHPAVVQTAMAGREQPGEAWDYSKFVAAGREVSYRAQWLLAELAEGVATVCGEDRLGKFAADIGVPESTLQACRQVAARFPADSRRQEIPWSVYRELVSQPDATELIARPEGWTVRQAREFRLEREIEAWERQEQERHDKRRRQPRVKAKRGKSGKATADPAPVAGRRRSPGKVIPLNPQPVPEPALDDTEDKQLPVVTAVPAQPAAAPEPSAEQHAGAQDQDAALRQAGAARNAARVLELLGEVERLQTENEALRERLADSQRITSGCERCSDMKLVTKLPIDHEQRPG